MRCTAHQDEPTIRAIGQRLAVAKYEVTYADWEACVGGGGCNGYQPNDYGMQDAEKVPVLDIDWDDAEAYVAWLSLVTGKTYRLLFEAEYEYAARAGTTTEYPWGDDIGKNNTSCTGCTERDNKRPAPVGSFPPNRFGLYDTVGNVYEWTEDCWHANYTNAPTDGSAWLTESDGDCKYRIVRGGSWDGTPGYLRSASRSWSTTYGRSNNLGFRVARTLAVRAGTITVAPGVH
jgi:formylglycine-generating enzyme required for sulfatase activity